MAFQNKKTSDALTNRKEVKSNHFIHPNREGKQSFVLWQITFSIAVISYHRSKLASYQETTINIKQFSS